jgi:glucose/arabinose dehydrogenase
MAPKPVIWCVAALWSALAWVGCPSVGVNAAQQTLAEPRVISGLPKVPLPDGPLVLHTHEVANVRVVVVTRGLSHPWGLAFLPDGSLLVTERDGRLRLVRDGVLDPGPIAGVPAAFVRGLAGMMDVALHPAFATNGLVYLSYSRPLAGGTATAAVVRGRLEGKTLLDLEDVFVADPVVGPTAGARMVFGTDGMLYVGLGGAFDTVPQKARAQDPSSHAGKVLRLRDDGSAPSDNPFAGKPGHKPEIFTLGHRNPMGLAFHPATQQLWAVEHSVQGGDELNIIEPGRNYGWPAVTFGRQYNGPRIAERFWAEGMQDPLVFWVPSIAPSGLLFYTGDRFPQWKGNVFVGSLMTGRIPRTGHLERLVLNERGEELRREELLNELRQRVRDVRQGPDGLIYVLTDEDEGVLLRLEPVDDRSTEVR